MMLTHQRRQDQRECNMIRSLPTCIYVRYSLWISQWAVRAYGSDLFMENIRVRKHRVNFVCKYYVKHRDVDLLYVYHTIVDNVRLNFSFLIIDPYMCNYEFFTWDSTQKKWVVGIFFNCHRLDIALKFWSF